MANPYHPIIQDKDRKIRKAIEKIRKRTRLEKSAILEIMMNYAMDKASEIFPEVKE